MSKQHFYPAALTGQFGVPAERRRRQRSRTNVVWLARRDSHEPRQVSAESIGWSNVQRELYDFSTMGALGATIDPLWSYAEARIPELVATLQRSRVGEGLGIEDYVRVLVPLAAQLMVRHPEFEDRIRGRLERQSQTTGRTVQELTPFDVNVGRLVEYSCLCGLLVRSKCTLIRTTSPLIGSELGYCGWVRAIGDVPDDYIFGPSEESDGVSEGGYLFPLHRNIAVCFTTGSAPSLAGGTVQLDHLHVTGSDVDDINIGIAGWTPAAIFGDQASVRRAAVLWQEQRERAPHSEMVPGMLSGPASINSGMAETFLRLVHTAQGSVEPEWSDNAFEECEGCQLALAQIRAVIG